MFLTVAGTYRNGQVELLEQVKAAENSRVIITFLPSLTSDALPLTPQQAAGLRWRLQFLEEDWNRPELEVYDAL